MTTSLTVAAVQSEPVWFDMAATTAKSIALIEQAAQRGADLIAFPEVWLPGYPLFLWLGDADWQREDRARYLANSPRVGGPEHHAIARAAADNGITVVLGFSERADDDRLYIAQLIVDGTGETILTRRKLKPSGPEAELWSAGDPTVNLKVIDTPLGRLGALNCAEHKRPMLRHVMYGLKEQVHIASWPALGLLPEVTAMGPIAQMASTAAYAADGGMYVVAATQVIGREIHDHYADTPERAGKISIGGGATHVFGPDGADVVPPLKPDEDGLLIAGIDYSRLRDLFDPEPLAPVR